MWRPAKLFFLEIPPRASSSSYSPPRSIMTYYVTMRRRIVFSKSGSRVPRTGPCSVWSQRIPEVRNLPTQSPETGVGCQILQGKTSITSKSSDSEMWKPLGTWLYWRSSIGWAEVPGCTPNERQDKSWLKWDPIESGFLLPLVEGRATCHFSLSNTTSSIRSSAERLSHFTYPLSADSDCCTFSPNVFGKLPKNTISRNCWNSE